MVFGDNVRARRAARALPRTPTTRKEEEEEERGRERKREEEETGNNEPGHHTAHPITHPAIPIPHINHHRHSTTDTPLTEKHTTQSTML